MTRTYLHLGIETAVWLLSMASTAIAVLLAALRPLRSFYFSVAFALGTVIVGCFGYWRPDSWPRIGYAYEFDGGWVVTLGSPSFFAVPLLLGTVALSFVIWRRTHFNHAA